MNEFITFQERVERLDRAILSSVEQFRSGNDHRGLDHFLNSIEDLKIVIASQKVSGGSQKHLDDIIKVLEKLYETMKNKDVVGMTDLLEYKLFPLTNVWDEERGDQ